MENKGRKISQTVRILIAIVVCCIIIAIPLTVKLVSDGNNGGGEIPSPEIIKVKVAISCANLFKEENSELLNDVKAKMGDSFSRLNNGEILAVTEVETDGKHTVMEIMKEISVKFGIDMRDNNGYVTSFNGLSEFMAGKESGWMYTINGGYALAANTTIPKNGDIIMWQYTVRMGDVV